MAAAIEAGDSTALAQAAHSLSGAAANIEAPSLARQAREVEIFGWEDRAAQAEEAFLALQREAEAFVAFVSDMKKTDP